MGADDEMMRYWDNEGDINIPDKSQKVLLKAVAAMFIKNKLER